MAQFATGIPKFIHQSADFYESLPNEVKSNIEKLKKLNPTWIYKFYDDKDAREFISDNFDWRYISAWESIGIEYGAAKADLFRYLLLYKTGGVWLDIKSSASKPFDEIFRPDDSFILSHWKNAPGETFNGWGIHEDLRMLPRGEFQNWFIASVPKHPYLENVIKRVIDNIFKYDPSQIGVGKIGVLRTTGPIAYTKAISAIKDQWPHREADSEDDLGLIYSIFHDKTGYNHHKIFKNHYSQQKSPIIKPDYINDEIITIKKSISFVSSNKISFPLIVSSHERSGTHFLMNSISDCTDYFANPYLDIGNRRNSGLIDFHNPNDVRSFFNRNSESREKSLRNIVKSHYDSRLMLPAIEGGARVVYIYRNPVDVFISFWKFLMKFPEEGGSFKTPIELASSCPQYSALRYQHTSYLCYFDRWYFHVLNWLLLASECSQISVLSYDQINFNFDYSIKRALNEIGVNITRSPYRRDSYKFIPGIVTELSEGEKNNIINFIQERMNYLEVQRKGLPKLRFHTEGDIFMTKLDW